MFVYVYRSVSCFKQEASRIPEAMPLDDIDSALSSFYYSVASYVFSFHYNKSV